jgi:hypothetical protein
MNELEFKRHLKDLAHGHHHPEEHDWTGEQPAAAKKKPAGKPVGAKRRTARKPAHKK